MKHRKSCPSKTQKPETAPEAPQTPQNLFEPGRRGIDQYPYATSVRDVEKAMVRILRDNLFGGEEKVLIEPYNGPRPKGCYASLLMKSVEPDQHEVYRFTEKRSDGRYIETVRGTKYCFIRIQFYNSGARQLAVDCQNLLRSHNRNFDLAPITGFGMVGEYTDISTEYMGRVEERVTMDVEVYALMSAEYDVGEIQFVKGLIVRDGDPGEYRAGGDACRLTFGKNGIRG